MRLLLLALTLAACECRYQAVDTAQDPEPPGVLRLGPPTPSVGVYGVAAHPDDPYIYVSNLHVPFLTLADPATGAWSGSLDLRDLGIQKTNFPRIWHDGSTVWITNLDSDQLLGFDAASHSTVDPITMPGTVSAARLVGESLWVATEEGAALRYEQGELLESVAVQGQAEAIFAEDDLLVLVYPDDQLLRAWDRSGEPLWELLLNEPEPSELWIMDGRVFVAARVAGEVLAIEDGAVVDRVHTGSDTFGLDQHGELLLVTNRQGAALPESGSYEGGPGLVTALDRDLQPQWSVETAKTIHFLGWDGRYLWTANEDSLQLSAIDPEAHREAIRGPRLGLTLDHLAEHQGRIYMGSHLTDELWRADLGAASSALLDSCGWPFQAAFVGQQGWVVCQESGDLQRFDPQSLEILETQDIQGSFHRICEDGLCTGHSLLVYALAHEDQLVWTEASLPSLRWQDGAVLSLPEKARGSAVQHLGIVELAGDLLVFGPATQQIYRVQDREIVDQTVEAAGEGVIIASQGWELASFDAAGLQELARLSMRELRVPPTEIWDLQPGPLRLLVSSQGELLVANAFWGTLERRGLPQLEPLGDDTVVDAARDRHLLWR